MNTIRNTQHRLYVFYAWKVEEQNNIVDKLEQACEQRGMTLLRDKNELDYKGSIRKYMDELAVGDAIILVLSEAYFKSAYCMYELRVAHERKDFHKSIFPIVTRDTPLHEPEDRVDYLSHWEEKCQILEQKLETIGRKYTKNLNESLDEYAENRRMIDELLAVLADMNTLTENIHVDSEFEAILNHIQPAQKQTDLRKPKRHRKSDDLFRKKIAVEIKQILAGHTSLNTALIAQADEHDIQLDNPVDLLQMAFETAIDDLLYPATKQCLSNLDYNSQDFNETWTAAKTLLGWLSILVVSSEWVAEQEKLRDTDDLSFAVQVKTSCGIEVASARFRQIPPQLGAATGKAEVWGQDGILPSQLNSGWSDEMPLQRILIAIWNKVFPEDTRQPLVDNFTEDDLSNLDYALAKREERKTHHYYIPIEQDQHIVERLLEQLPSITVIYLKATDCKPTLRVENEGRFMSVIREFLTMNDN